MKNRRKWLLWIVIALLVTGIGILYYERERREIQLQKELHRLIDEMKNDSVRFDCLNEELNKTKKRIDSLCK